MSWFDVLVLAFFLVMGYRGFRDGFVFHLGRIGGPMLGLFFALKTHESWGQALSARLNVPYVLLGAFVFLLVSVSITVVVGLMGRWLKDIMQQGRFGTSDRIVGAGFGLLCAFVITGSFITFVFGSKLSILTKLGGVVETSGITYRIFTWLPFMYGTITRLFG
ncbi:MAG: CvpA family protein [Limnochordia bacterium]|jgi:uncharacterized membrane protein required for colicin V production|nr:CvpA family protein [Limnochordia bacterium]MDD2630754.1 CvpA family protein [Limnochordia bacterium]MDD4517888.1 CvpA family protein [Limnochordia bacterium]